MSDNVTNLAVDTKPPSPKMAGDTRILQIGAMCGTSVLAAGMLLLLILGSVGVLPPLVLQRYGEILIYLCPGIFVVFGVLYGVRRAMKA